MNQTFEAPVGQAFTGDDKSQVSFTIFNFASLATTSEDGTIETEKVNGTAEQTGQLLSKTERNTFISELIKFHEKHPQFKKILQKYATAAYSGTYYQKMNDVQLLNLVGFKNLLTPILDELIEYQVLAEVLAKDCNQRFSEAEQHKAQAEALKQRYESGAIKGILNILTK